MLLLLLITYKQLSSRDVWCCKNDPGCSNCSNLNAGFSKLLAFSSIDD